MVFSSTGWFFSWIMFSALHNHYFLLESVFSKSLFLYSSGLEFTAGTNLKRFGKEKYR